LIKVVFRYNST